ncbi:MAG: hypothetical protein NXI09_04525 [Bacteroidetes bacterium]|nr:hypothetical protein [Bacteroidota bacterium]
MYPRMQGPSLISTRFNLTFVLLLSIVGALASCQNSNTPKSSERITKSEIRLTDEGYRLFLNDTVFYVKGAGLGNDKLEDLKAHGANAFRTWSASSGTYSGLEVLDKAAENDLKVAMGLGLGLERHGFDYDDGAAVKKQKERIRQQVLKLKDHPALMIWVLGNELNHHSENPKVWDALNDIVRMIHEIDSNHLCTTPLAGMKAEDVKLVQERCPDLDFLSVQLYGEIEILPELIAEAAYEGPLMITEWGATGYWEVEKTKWGAPIENHSSLKADFYGSRYKTAIASQSQQVMGSFVFFWGQKQERTPTWFGMYLANGQETEAIDVMHHIWTGAWPENRSPRLEDFSLEGHYPADNIRLKTGAIYQAQASASDPDQDSLQYRWLIMRESESTATGGDREEIPESLDLFTGSVDHRAEFKAPSDTGAYRLFVYVEDGQNHSAHANIPFWVYD